MTFKELVHRIEVVASKQPTINMVVENDVYRLNNVSDARYGVFAWLQGQHSASVTSDLQTFKFTFFYVDRLTSEQGNQIEVQSVGMQTLDNIIRTLDDMGLDASDFTFQAFNQRFLDECAGVFCNVSFNVPVESSCGESFEDFNDDFNNDFFIF